MEYQIPSSVEHRFYYPDDLKFRQKFLDVKFLLFLQEFQEMKLYLLQELPEFQDFL
ncbi:hypothetical protein D3C84_1256750 [compost metagenome]